MKAKPFIRYHRPALGKAVALEVIVLLVAAAVLVAIIRPDWIATDVVTYVAAGERLNAGHALYYLVPGDRPLLLNPPFWTVPLMSPPLIAVLWSPFALLPGGLAIPVGWLVSAAATATSIMIMCRRRAGITAVALAVLIYPFAAEIVAGNIDSIILLVTLACWTRRTDRREFLLGIAVGVLIAAKLTPLTIAWWLIVERRWAATAGAMAAAIAATLCAVAVAGFYQHQIYLTVIGQSEASGASYLSLGGIAQLLVGTTSIPGWAPPAIALSLGLLSMWWFRRNPHLTYRIGIAISIFGSPVVYPTNLVRLLAIAAPSVLGSGGVEPARVPPRDFAERNESWLLLLRERVASRPAAQPRSTDMSPE